MLFTAVAGIVASVAGVGIAAIKAINGQPIS